MNMLERKPSGEGPARTVLWRWVAAVVIAAASVLTLALLGLYGIGAIGWIVLGALHAVPPAIAIHVLQLLLSALAWRSLVARDAPSLWAMFKARLVREGINSLLPVGGVGGSVAAARLLTRHGGLQAFVAGASSAVDITCEAVGQLLFLVVAVAVAAVLTESRLEPSLLLAVFTPVILVVLTLGLAQRFGVLGVIERLALRWLPRIGGAALSGLHEQARLIYQSRGGVLRAVGWHFCSWSLGAAEVWVLLRATGYDVSMPVAYAVEALGLAARSAAFAVPAGLAAQEAGLVLACGLFGVPPQAALALSMLKRLRELAVGIPAVVLWQWAEGRDWVLRSPAARA